MLDCTEKLGGAAVSGPGKVDWDDMLAVTCPSPKPRVFTVKGGVCWQSLSWEWDEIQAGKEDAPSRVSLSFPIINLDLAESCGSPLQGSLSPCSILSLLLDCTLLLSSAF